MKIKGWEKISGYTYKGYTIVNPIHNAEETRYEATILDLNLPQKPKWELVVLTPKHKFLVGSSPEVGTFFITMRDDENRTTINSIDKQRMASLLFFRNMVEEMIDKLLAMRLTSASTPNSHSIHNSYTNILNPANYGNVVLTGTGGGILTTINSNANNVVWDPTTNLPSSMLMAIKDLQEQIDNLKTK